MCTHKLLFGEVLSCNNNIPKFHMSANPAELVQGNGWSCPTPVVRYILL